MNGSVYSRYMRNLAEWKMYFADKSATEVFRHKMLNDIVYISADIATSLAL